MKIREGKWETKGGNTIEIIRDGGFFKVVGINGGIDDQLEMYYDDRGKMIRNSWFVRNVDSAVVFEPWDIEESIVSLKRNSNPIFMLDLCTE